MIFWVGVTGEQLTNWLIMSVFTSLYIGWITVKADSKFAPWFYRKMGMDKTPPRTNDEKLLDHIRSYCKGKENVNIVDLIKKGL